MEELPRLRSSGVWSRCAEVEPRGEAWPWHQKLGLQFRTIQVSASAFHSFLSLVTADHKVLNKAGESRNNHRYAVVVQDLATLVQTKTSQETEKSLRKFLEPSQKPKVIYTDNSSEFGKACETPTWNHCTSTPHRSETSGIAERAARRVMEGTSAVLLQSGSDEKWWADSMDCCCYLRNVQDFLAGGTTLHERRHVELFKGAIIPFGAMIEYHPTSVRDQSRLP